MADGTHMEALENAIASLTAAVKQHSNDSAARHADYLQHRASDVSRLDRLETQLSSIPLSGPSRGSFSGPSPGPNQPFQDSDRMDALDNKFSDSSRNALDQLAFISELLAEMIADSESTDVALLGPDEYSPSTEQIDTPFNNDDVATFFIDQRTLPLQEVPPAQMSLEGPISPMKWRSISIIAGETTCGNQYSRLPPPKPPEPCAFTKNLPSFSRNISAIPLLESHNGGSFSYWPCTPDPPWVDLCWKGSLRSFSHALNNSMPLPPPKPPDANHRAVDALVVLSGAAIAVCPQPVWENVRVNGMQVSMELSIVSDYRDFKEVLANDKSNDIWVLEFDFEPGMFRNNNPLEPLLDFLCAHPHKGHTLMLNDRLPRNSKFLFALVKAECRPSKLALDTPYSEFEYVGMGSCLFDSYADPSGATLVFVVIPSFGINHDFTTMLNPLLVHSRGILPWMITTLLATKVCEIKAVTEIQPASKDQLIISLVLRTIGIGFTSGIGLCSSFTLATSTYNIISMIINAEMKNSNFWKLFGDLCGIMYELRCYSPPNSDWTLLVFKSGLGRVGATLAIGVSCWLLVLWFWTEKGTTVAWIICGSIVFNQFFLSPTASMNYVALEIPLKDFPKYDADSCVLCMVNCDNSFFGTNRISSWVLRALVTLVWKSPYVLMRAAPFAPVLAKLLGTTIAKFLFFNAQALVVVVTCHAGVIICNGYAAVNWVGTLRNAHDKFQSMGDPDFSPCGIDDTLHTLNYDKESIKIATLTGYSSEVIHIYFANIGGKPLDGVTLLTSKGGSIFCYEAELGIKFLPIHRKNWDPVGGYYFIHITGSLRCKQWDPGGCLLAYCEGPFDWEATWKDTNFNLEDKVDFNGGSNVMIGNTKRAHTVGESNSITHEGQVANEACIREVRKGCRERKRNRTYDDHVL